MGGKDVQYILGANLRLCSTSYFFFSSKITHLSNFHDILDMVYYKLCILAWHTICESLFKILSDKRHFLTFNHIWHFYTSKWVTLTLISHIICESFRYLLENLHNFSKITKFARNHNHPIHTNSFINFFSLTVHS